MTFRITFKNNISQLVFPLIGTCLMFVTLFLFHFDPYLIDIFIIAWLVYTIPAIYLHLEYFVQNYGQRIDFKGDQIVYHGRDEVTKNYNYDDIEKVILYKSASLDKGGIQLSPIEGYHFVRISLKGGGEIIITCLMVKNFDQVLGLLKGAYFERKKRLFCGISFSF